MLDIVSEREVNAIRGCTYAPELGTCPYFVAWRGWRTLGCEAGLRGEAKIMNSAVGSPQIGQWYERTDTAEVFRVTGIDDGAGTTEIQSFDGDVDEIDT